MYSGNRIRELKKDFLKLQEGRCAICGDTTPRNPGLDHDHRTGGFRGVLCGPCNQGLGMFCDSPELLRKAAAYLEIPRIVRFPRKKPYKLSKEHRRKLGESLSKVMKGNQNCLGWHHTKETRRKISEASKRENLSEETRHKRSEAAKGRKFSKEHRRHLSEAQKGRKLSEETKRKIGEGGRGKKVSKETRRKMSEAAKRNSKKTSQQMKGNQNNLGHKHSLATRRKMSKSHRRRIQNAATAAQ